jgi:hypothetical protein
VNRGEPLSDRTEEKPEFPGDGASDPQRRDWLQWAFSVPEGSRIGEVTRYGADDVTPMTVEIIPPGNGEARIVRFEEEHEAAGYGTLRRALIRDGGLRAEYVTSAKIAGDAYYLLCKLARVIGGGDPRDEAREWLAGYREEANRAACSLAKSDLYGTLETLRCFPYSKRQISMWLNALDRGERLEPPRPPLLVDDKGGEWTSVTHLATYVRWGRDQPGAISNKALTGLVVELGGKRWRARAWDTTTRERQRQICTVLVRLPEVSGAPEDEQRV